MGKIALHKFQVACLDVVQHLFLFWIIGNEFFLELLRKTSIHIASQLYIGK